MNFQFYCPQGHLLQGDTAHSGSVIACPICGTQFIIPTPPPAAAPVVSPVVPSPENPFTAPPAETNPFAFSSNTAKSTGTNLNELLGSSDASTPEKPEEEKVEMASPFDFNKEKNNSDEEKLLHIVPKSAQELSLLHIPCPQGHLLEVPRDMIGEDALCPYCKVQYKILLENSVEYRKEQLEKTALEEAKLAKKWLQWAIIATVLLVLFLLFLFFTTQA